MRTNAHKLQISSQHELLYVQSGRALEQTAQGSHRSSLSGYIQNSPGQIPLSPALDDPGTWVGLGHLKWLLSTLMILGFCDFHKEKVASLNEAGMQT